MPSPAVTVLTTVYNGARYLEEAVRSILVQTFADFEFVIINDGSRDQSRQILERFHDPRIRLVHTENRGTAAAAALGVQESRGGMIARMDADDVSMADRLETQVEFLRRHPDVGVVASDFVNIDAGGVALWTSTDATLDESTMISWRLLWENVVCHSTVMIRRDVLEATGINYDARCVVEDYDIWTRLLLHTRFGHVPRALVHYRRMPGGITATRGAGQLEATAEIQQRTLSTLVGRTLDPRVGPSVALLSQQTAVHPPPAQVLDAHSLVVMAKEVRRAFEKRFHPCVDRSRIDADLSRRFLDWGRVLSRLPGRSHDATGVLMREALSLNPRVFLDRRLWRNLALRLIGQPSRQIEGPALRIE